MSVLARMDREPDQPECGVVVGEVSAGLDRLADLHVEALDGVGGVDDPADLFGEGEERDHSCPRRVSQTWRAAVRVLLFGPGGGELVEYLAGGVGVGGGVDAS